MVIHTIDVNTNNNSYPIHISPNIFSEQCALACLQKGVRVIIVTNTVVSNLWKNFLINYLMQCNVIIDEFILPDGENYKNLSSVDLLLSYLLQKKHDRKSILIALGGGVIGDLTGFVASIYQRGIQFIQVPTTLLSQVDAAIGGKTGVNHIYGKNMIGTFWQPISVVVNINFLYTLSKNQFLSGLAEVVKYAIAFDYKFFTWLENNIDKILSLNLDTLVYCIKKCCTLKSNIVNLDEREDNCRALLNLGHTYGHAIEAYFKYKSWLHGEAVSVGIVLAMKTSQMLGILSISDFNRVVNLLKLFGLPTHPPKEMLSCNYLKYMERDKKNYYGNIQLVLPIKIGEVKLFNKVSKQNIISVIESF